MNDKREIESSNKNYLLLANDRPITSELEEVRKIHRKGGYFVGVAGWSGFMFRTINKLYAFLVSGIGWAGLIAIGWIVMDETVRVTLRGALGVGPQTVITGEEGLKFPLLKDDNFQQLPINWKQLLAEVQINQSIYPPRFVSLIRELTLKDITKLDHIAPYVVGNSIIHAEDFDIGYDIPSVADVDFERLKTIGITTDGTFGMNIPVAPKNDKPATHVFRGSTLALVVRAPDPVTKFTIHVTSLTEEGEQIMRLLNKPTSLEAICKIAARLKDRKKLEVLIFARFEPAPDDNAWISPEATANVSSLCSRHGVSVVE